MTPARLYNYFRSSTSYRVRAALRFKKVEYEYLPVHIRKGGQDSAEYRAMNPQRLVPTLVLGNAPPLAQSLAIIEYLEERFPEPPLLPADPLERAKVRSIAYMIAMDTHPLNNLRVLSYLRDNLDADELAIATWFRHWVAETFEPLETILRKTSGRYCVGDAVTLADLCVVAQVASNTRFDVPMAPYPTISRIYAACMELPEFAETAPGRQPDAE